MKTKTRAIPAKEFWAIVFKLSDEVGSIHIQNGTQFYMSTGDFERTQSMAEARWILSLGEDEDVTLLQVDGIGDAIVLIPE